MACPSEEWMLDILREMQVLVERMENLPEEICEDMEDPDYAKVTLWKAILKAIIMMMLSRV